MFPWKYFNMKVHTVLGIVRYEGRLQQLQLRIQLGGTRERGRAAQQQHARRLPRDRRQRHCAPRLVRLQVVRLVLRITSTRYNTIIT